jgi:hypothetical protein
MMESGAAGRQPHTCGCFRQPVATEAGGEEISVMCVATAIGMMIRSSAHCFLDQRGDLLLIGGGQLRQRERNRPHSAFVEIR